MYLFAFRKILIFSGLTKFEVSKNNTLEVSDLQQNKDRLEKRYIIF